MIGAELWTLLAAAAGVFVTLAGLLWKARQSGHDKAVADQVRKDDETRKEFERIDAGAPSLGDSLDRLRKRSRNDNRADLK